MFCRKENSLSPLLMNQTALLDCLNCSLVTIIGICSSSHNLKKKRNGNKNMFIEQEGQEISTLKLTWLIFSQFITGQVVKIIM
jgi:hypothetical protein